MKQEKQELQEKRFIGFHADNGLREWIRKRAYETDCPVADAVRRELEFARACRARGIHQHNPRSKTKGTK